MISNEVRAGEKTKYREKSSSRVLDPTNPKKVAKQE